MKDFSHISKLPSRNDIAFYQKVTSIKFIEKPFVIWLDGLIIWYFNLLYLRKLITNSKYNIESIANILYRLPWVITFFISLLDWLIFSLPVASKRYLGSDGKTSLYGFPGTPHDFKENFGKRKSFCMQQKCYRESISAQEKSFRVLHLK